MAKTFPERVGGSDALTPEAQWAPISQRKPPRHFTVSLRYCQRQGGIQRKRQAADISAPQPPGKQQQLRKISNSAENLPFKDESEITWLQIQKNQREMITHTLTKELLKGEFQTEETGLRRKWNDPQEEMRSGENNKHARKYFKVQHHEYSIQSVKLEREREVKFPVRVAQGSEIGNLVSYLNPGGVISLL